MTKDEFIELFVEELEIEDNNLNLDTELSATGVWDSLSILITIGLVSDNFNVTLTHDDMKILTTVNSLIERIGVEKFDDIN